MNEILLYICIVLGGIVGFVVLFAIMAMSLFAIGFGGFMVGTTGEKEQK